MYARGVFVWLTPFLMGLATAFSLQALGKDVFLTIGGGYAASGNQVPLENNVLFLQRMLHEKFPDGVDHEVYFADGDEPNPELQFVDPDKAKECPPAHRLMCEVMGCADSVGICYRNHHIPNVAGPTEVAVIRRRFEELGRELQAGDRLFVYVTGHGAASEGRTDSADYDYEYDEVNKKWVATAYDQYSEDEAQEFNTSFYLWDTEQVKATEFNRWLDQLPLEVNVVLVMVQCYSGGFANEIFHRHDPELGLAPHRRCGFFAQLHDRGAAGCTPEVNQADYQEYSTYFWAALGAKTRLEEMIEPPDYDGDGRVSFAEAHAYVVIESDTIDIPVRTSEALLRRYSRLGRQQKPDGSGEHQTPLSGFFGLFGSKQQTNDTQEPQPLLDATGPVAELLPKARPDQRAILLELPKKLQLAEPVTVEMIRLKLKQSGSSASALSRQFYSARETLTECETDLKEDVCQFWPELNEAFSPLAAELTSTRADEFVERVQSLPSYAAWTAASKREKQLTDELLQAQHTEARVQRLLRTIEDVVYAANLSRCAPAAVVEKYEQLLALEEGTLGPTKANEADELVKQ